MKIMIILFGKKKKKRVLSEKQLEILRKGHEILRKKQ